MADETQARVPFQESADVALISTSTTDVAATVRSEVLEAAKADQENTIAAVKKVVEDALKEKDKAILATLEQARLEPGRPKKDEGTFLKILLVVVPVVLAGIITGVFSIRLSTTEGRIKEQIDGRISMLQTRLALTEEFHKRQLNAFEEVYNQMIDVLVKLRSAQSNSDNKTAAFESLGNLNKTALTKELYLVGDLAEQLGQVYLSGVETEVFSGAPGTQKIAEVEVQIKSIGARIKEEVARLIVDTETDKSKQSSKDQSPAVNANPSAN